MAAATSTKMPPNWASRSMRSARSWAGRRGHTGQVEEGAGERSSAMRNMEARIHLTVAWSESRQAMAAGRPSAG